MFKNLMDLWKGKDFLTAVLGSFEEMLKHAETLFVMSTSALIKETKGKTEKDELYRIDKQVNRLERSIRRRIVEHLSIQPGIEVSSCLILMSVVKDAERLGDYAKNLFEVGEMLDEPYTQREFDKMFGGMDARVKKLYEMTRKAFIDSDESLAREVMTLEHKIVTECDDMLVDFAKGPLKANRAVCSALTARYFKRFSAHLGNIASSVIVPVSDLDYFDEKKL